MNARISQLHKTESEWTSTAHKGFMPKAGELVIYDPDASHPYARLKVGDGKTLLKNLAFVVDAAAVDAIRTHRFDEFVDGGRITDWVKK